MHTVGDKILESGVKVVFNFLLIFRSYLYGSRPLKLIQIQYFYCESGQIVRTSFFSVRILRQMEKKMVINQEKKFKNEKNQAKLFTLNFRNKFSPRLENKKLFKNLLLQTRPLIWIQEGNFRNTTFNNVYWYVLQSKSSGFFSVSNEFICSQPLYKCVVWK